MVNKNIFHNLIFVFLFSLPVFSEETPYFFPDKYKGANVDFLEVNGEIVARYKTADDMFGQLFIERRAFTKYPNIRDYPIASYPGSLSVARMSSGYTIRRKKIDSRVNSGCPLESNYYLAVYNNKKVVIKEYMFVYMAKSVVNGDLSDCPNSIGTKNKYQSRFISLHGPIFLNKDESKLFVVGGEGIGEHDFMIEINVNAPSQLLIENYCGQKKIYVLDVGLVRKKFLDDELSYQHVLDNVWKIARDEKELSCR